jgi:Lysozyme like domain
VDSDRLMTKLSDNNIAWLAEQAGFQGQDLVTAVAVALAESSGETTSVNPKVNSVRGLWQINYAAHPTVAAKIDYLFNPVVNAHAAYTVFRGSGWGAWTTYTNGAYEQYVQRARIAVAKPAKPSFNQLTGNDPWSNHIPGASAISSAVGGTVNAPVGAVSSAYDATTSIASFLGQLVNKSVWIRAVEILAGVVAVLIALYVAAKGIK